MEAGRELDALVAEHVMHDVYVTEGEWAGYWHTPGMDGHSSNDDCGSYRYSANMNDAWRIVEYLLTTKGVQMQVTPVGYNGGWQCKRVDPGGNAVASGPYAPEAICKAALKTVGIDTEKILKNPPDKGPSILVRPDVPFVEQPDRDL